MKGLRIGLWVVQVLLALAFLGAGFMKVAQPYDQIAANMAWAKDFSPTAVMLIGVVELLAAIGLILPSLTRILPVLTPVAAVGLVLTMIGATIAHARLGEPVVVTIVLGLLSAFVAWGRFSKAPIAARSAGSASPTASPAA